MDNFQFALTMFAISGTCLSTAVVVLFYTWWKYPEIFSNRTRNFGGGSHE